MVLVPNVTQFHLFILFYFIFFFLGGGALKVVESDPGELFLNFFKFF